jgi:hypothetical protein
MRSIVFILSSLVVLTVSPLHSQSVIKGQLVNARDTSALYGAIIVLRHFPDSTLKGSVADTAGNFELQIDSVLPKFIVDKSDTSDILDYVHTICNAKEVHFINSGLYPLIALLSYLGLLKANKVVYHNTRKFHQGGLPIQTPSQFKHIDY